MRRGPHADERNDGHVARRVSSFPQSSRRVTMSDLAERPSRVGVKRALLRWSTQFERIRSPLLRYGLSVVCCAIATGLGLVLYRNGIRGMELGLLCLPVAIATWYGGIGASVLAVLLCTASFNYFFVEPLFSFYV